MIYNDGFPMNEDKRVTICPQCKNEQFSDNAEYCRICSTPLFNLCEGQDEWDEYGNNINTQYHRNLGNARYCEICGKATMYFKMKLLRPYTMVLEDYQENDSDTDNYPF